MDLSSTRQALSLPVGMIGNVSVSVHGVVDIRLESLPQATFRAGTGVGVVSGLG